MQLQIRMNSKQMRCWSACVALRFQECEKKKWNKHDFKVVLFSDQIHSETSSNSSWFLNEISSSSSSSKKWNDINKQEIGKTQRSTNKSRLQIKKKKHRLKGGDQSRVKKKTAEYK